MIQLRNIVLAFICLISLWSCDYWYSVGFDNDSDKAIYIYSPKGGMSYLSMEDAPDLDELHDKLYLQHIAPGQTGTLAEGIGYHNMSKQWIIDNIFSINDVLFVAIFDAEIQCGG